MELNLREKDDHCGEECVGGSFRRTTDCRVRAIAYRRGVLDQGENVKGPFCFTCDVCGGDAVRLELMARRLGPFRRESGRDGSWSYGSY